MTTTLTDISRDNIYEMVNDAPLDMILNLCKVNKKLNKYLCQNGPFWQRKIKRDFNINVSIPKGSDLKDKYINLLKYKNAQKSIIKALEFELGYFHILNVEARLSIYQTVIDFFDKKYAKNYKTARSEIGVKDAINTEIWFYEDSIEDDYNPLDDRRMYNVTSGYSDEYLNFQHYLVTGLGIKILNILGVKSSNKDIQSLFKSTLTSEYWPDDFYEYLTDFVYFSMGLFDGYVQYKVQQLRPDLYSKVHTKYGE